MSVTHPSPSISVHEWQWELVTDPVEFYGDGILAASGPEVESWLRDMEVHGPQHQHHASGLVFFRQGSDVVVPTENTPEQCHGVLLPVTPGEVAVYRDTRSGDMLVDAFHGAPVSRLTWAEGPLLTASTGEIHYYDLHQEDPTPAPFAGSMLPTGTPLHTIVGVDQDWREPRYLLLRPQIG